jgi:hypothetical protein
MTREQIEAAILQETPVVYTNPVDRQPIRDQIPRALIWRNTGKGKMVWQVELQDKCRRSVIICSPRQIKLEFEQNE